jgi:hypothetical protein
MPRIRRTLAANSPQFIVHPIIHVEDKLPDGVWESFQMPHRQFGGEIFDASDGISVRALAMQEFG